MNDIYKDPVMLVIFGILMVLVVFQSIEKWRNRRSQLAAPPKDPWDDFRAY